MRGVKRMKNPKSNKKAIIRKIIYLILFSLMIFAFIYLSNRYSALSVRKDPTITDYYPTIKDTSKYDIMKADATIKEIKDGTSLIMIGSHTSKWSNKYIEEIEAITKELKITKIKYYDLNNDKSQRNSNYYEIKELLNGHLTTTDGSENNLLAPSFYIIVDGQVKYYNIDTVAMKNDITVEDYWTPDQEEQFASEITAAINKYYLNNQSQ